MKELAFSFLLLHIASAGFIDSEYMYTQELLVKAQGVCPELDDPEFGEVNYCETDVGDTACYCCCDDYMLEGDEERTCQSDGTWSGDEPVCRYTLACPALSDPANGNVDLSSGTDIGSVATYSCDDGYTLSGSDTRTCEDGGLWSGDAPMCIVSQCSALSNPDNGAVVPAGTKVDIGDTATYTCDDGYELNGSGTLTCQSDGQWSGSPPTCEAVQCNALSDPANGAVSTTGNGVGDTATYTCDDGYELNGSGTRTCQSSGDWSGTAPTCEMQEVDCGTPPDVPDGTYTLSDGTKQGSVATYSCNTGYKLKRNNQNKQTCSASGDWSGTLPQCDNINECSKNKGGCQQICVDDEGSFHCECRKRYVLLPDGVSCTKVNIELTDDSPIVGEGSVSADIINNDNRITKIECTVTCSARGCKTSDGKNAFPWKDCTDGTYEQDGMRVPIRHCLRIRAYITLSDGSTIVYREPPKCFVQGSKENPIYCAVNRVGEPEYVGANDITLAFAPSGPFDSYGCSHDGGNTFEACTSRYQSNNSSPGPGQVLICPVSQTCADAPTVRPRSSACRCLSFRYDTERGDSRERYFAGVDKCLTPEDLS